MSSEAEPLATSTSQSSTTSECGVTDADVNEAYNLFSAEQMRFYRGINVKLNRSFLKRKKQSPDEWLKFRSVVEICRKNGIDVRCFIKFCFLNRLAPKQKGRTLKDVEYLTHYQQLAAYERERKTIETCYKTYMSIIKSVMRIRNLSKRNNESVKDTLKSVLGSENLSNYIMTGTVSRYFLSLVPNMESILHELIGSRKAVADSDVIYDFNAHIAVFRASAAKALKMFWPLALNKSILELCC